jgi:hypothetical protein
VALLPFCDHLGEPREVARELPTVRSKLPRSRDQNSLVCLDQVGVTIELLHVGGTWRGRQLDLDGPQAAAQIEDQVDLALITGPQIEGADLAPSL